MADFSNSDIHLTMEKKYCPPCENTHKFTSTFSEQEFIIQNFTKLAVKVFLGFCLVCSGMCSLVCETNINFQQGKSPDPCPSTGKADFSRGKASLLPLEAPLSATCSLQTEVGLEAGGHLSSSLPPPNVAAAPAHMSAGRAHPGPRPLQRRPYWRVCMVLAKGVKAKLFCGVAPECVESPG